MVSYESMQELLDRLRLLEKKVQDGLKFLKLPELEQKIKNLEEEMQAPGFWDNAQKAQHIAREQGILDRKVTAWKRLKTDLIDGQELATLINEEEHPDEAAELKKQVEGLEKTYQDLEIQLYLSGKYDASPAMLSLHASAGGTDAQDWAEMLLRMYTRYAEGKGWKISLVEKSDGEEAGIKSATLRVEGDFTYGLLKEEAGMHRLVRLSPFNVKHTRETSFCRVEVVPEIEANELQIKDEDLKIDVFRAGGHGGQGVNTTDSAVRITHLPTGIVVQCQNERSQLQNKELAMKSLTSKLVVIQEKNRLKELKDIKGEHVEGAWGTQIRSYVLHPYQMVKDHRTKKETSQVDAVLAGDPEALDGFIEESLKSEQASH
ncbi:MAG: protein chain release factor B [uncultured bacterium]|nr:MAG: protein chain release factor B [uncultured bacterium]